MYQLWHPENAIGEILFCTMSLSQKRRVSKAMIVTKKVKRGIWLFFGGLFLLNFAGATGAYICGVFSTQFYWIMIGGTALLAFAEVFSLRFSMSQAENCLRD